MKKTFATAIVMIAFLISAPSLFAEDEEGFFIFGDLQSMMPANVDHTVAVLNDETNDPIERFDRWTLDYSSDFTYRFGVGYSWGENGRLYISYWTYSDEESDRRADTTGNVNIDDTFWGESLPGPFEAIAMSEIEASTFEVIYARDHHFENNWSLTWMTGFKMADFEEMVRIDYANPDFATFEADPASYEAGYDLRQLEVDGFGVTAGITGTYHASDVIDVFSGVSFGYLFGESDNFGLEIENNFGFDTMEIITKSEDVAGLITDMSAGVKFDLGEYFDLSLAYTFSSWDDFATNYLGNADDINGDQSIPIRENITWHGFNLGVHVQF